MNAKELRAAATNLARHMEIAYASTAAMGPTPIQRMAGTLIDHILATVREDDDDLIDSHWCRSAALGPSWDGGFVELGSGFQMNFVNRFPELETVRNVPIAKVKTRGEFRALCRLLGVTLKEDV